MEEASLFARSDLPLPISFPNRIALPVAMPKPTTATISRTMPTTEEDDDVEEVSENIAESNQSNAEFVEANPETGAIDITIGTKVAHPIFGEGTVTSLDEEKGRIWVDFRAGHKMFSYPDAFEQGYLNL